MRIRIFIALMVAVIMLPLVLASAFAVNQIRLEEQAASLATLHKTVDAISLTVDRDIQASISALQALSNSEHLQTGNYESFYVQAKAINRSQNSWVGLFRPDGTQILNTAVAFAETPKATKASALVGKVIASQKPFVSDIFVGPLTGRQLVAVYVPTTQISSTNYVVAQGFSLAHWKDIAKHQDLPADWIVAIIDRAGRFISRSHKSDEFLGRAARPELVAAAANTKQGLIRHSTMEGIESYHRRGGTGGYDRCTYRSGGTNCSRRFFVSHSDLWNFGSCIRPTICFGNTKCEWCSSSVGERSGA